MIKLVGDTCQRTHVGSKSAQLHNLMTKQIKFLLPHFFQSTRRHFANSLGMEIFLIEGNPAEGYLCRLFNRHAGHCTIHAR